MPPAGLFTQVEEAAFMPLSSCPQCQLAGRKDSPVHLHTKLSLFLPFQTVKVQEPTNQASGEHQHSSASFSSF